MILALFLLLALALFALAAFVIVYVAVVVIICGALFAGAVAIVAGIVGLFVPGPRSHVE